MSQRILFDPMEDALKILWLHVIELEVCQECGAKKRATWGTLRVPDQRLGGQNTQNIPKRSPEYSRVSPEIH